MQNLIQEREIQMSLLDEYNKSIQVDKEKAELAKTQLAIQEKKDELKNLTGLIVFQCYKIDKNRSRNEA